MSRTLIAYSSVDGQTLKICNHIKQVLERGCRAVELVEVGGATAVEPASFDQVVIGASVRYGRHRGHVHQFVEANRAALERIPSSFFSVNVVARKLGKDTAESNPYVQAFLRKTGWAPTLVGVFAGKIDYPLYGFVDRQIIRLIMWLSSGPTDPTTSVEFTDWQAVERFAQQVLGMGNARDIRD